MFPFEMLSIDHFIQTVVCLDFLSKELLIRMACNRCRVLLKLK